MQRNKLIKIFPDILVLLCCMVSIVLSIIESRVNDDSFHWGLMYVNALDLNQGLVPYKEIAILYGFLTTLIQSFSLNVFGKTVVSIGIITGIFYAINIFLSYCLWQKILNKWLSSISAILMFLVHGYIIFPWANYFCYTFILAFLLFLTSTSQKKYLYLFAGIFAGFSFLARQVLIPILAPVYIYFILVKYISSEKKLQRLNYTNIILFHTGIISVIGIFLVYLLLEGAFNDWIAQSFTVIKVFSTAYGSAREVIYRFLSGIFLGKTNGIVDIRSILYSLIFFNALIFWIRILYKIIRKQITEQEKLLFLFSSVVLLGYYNSLHLYQIFRLQSSSSLGFGLLILSLYDVSTRFGKWKKFVFIIPVVCLFIYLSQTFVFIKTTSVYSPWNKDLLLSDKLKEPENIDFLQGKLYDEKTRNYYQTLAKTMNKYSSQLEYYVNLSSDSYISVYSQLPIKSVQRLPHYIDAVSNCIFQDEQKKIAELLKKKKAILVTSEFQFNKIPENYEVVLEINIPIPQIWTGKKIYIAVPEKLHSQHQPAK